MIIVPRRTITQPTYREILDVETNHNHEIIKDSEGTLRWKENPYVREAMEKAGMNEIVHLFYTLGYNRNSEPYRKLYRDIGYSLYGYWEIFYWDANNPDAHKYKPSVSVPVKDLAKKLRHKKV